MVYNVNTNVKDSGALYAEDFTEKKSTNITIKDNFVRDWSRHAPEARAIYLDEGTSNALVTGNIVGPPGTAMRGTTSILMSSGSNNMISGNIYRSRYDGQNSILIHYNMPHEPRSDDEQQI